MIRRCEALATTVFILAVSTIALAADPEVKSPPARVLLPDQTLNDLKTYLHRHAPQFVAPTNAGKWNREARRLRQRVLDEVVLRGVPESWLDGSPRVVWGETIPAAGYTVRKLRYEAVPGLWVGALLYEPVDLKGKVPAVLNPNGHVGKPGMTVDYKQARCINLAKRGFLALNPEWIGMGQLSGPGYGHNDLAYLDLCGRSGLSVFYLVLKRGLDVLLSHKAADPERVAVTGLSGGGWQTILISSLDPRVRLAAPNAGFIGIASRIEHPEDIGDLEQNATDLVSVADYVHLTALLAPRPALLIYNDKDDCCFQADRARPSVYEPIRPVYQLLGHPERFAFHVNSDPGTHNYLKDNREAFFRFFNRNFVPEKEWIDEDVPADEDIRKPEALAITYPADNANFHTLAAEAMKSLPQRKRPTGEGMRVRRWRRETRRALGRVVRPERTDSVTLERLPMAAIPEAAAQTTASVFRVRIGDSWTLPMVEYAAGGDGPDTTTLILADGGFEDARNIAAASLAHGERVVLADLLFTGECVPGKPGDCWKYAQMIGTEGRRPLGIQIAQLDAVINHIGAKHPGKGLRVITKGRVAGLAALAYAALQPGRLGRLELREIDASLKDLLANKVGYGQAPSLFCFGLLELADVPELIDLAPPTRVEFIRAN